MDFAPRQDITCPSSQLLYTCSSNGFHGCCSINPCGSGGCPGIPLPKQPSTAEKSSSDFQSTQQTSSTEKSSSNPQSTPQTSSSEKSLPISKSDPKSTNDPESTTEIQTSSKSQTSGNTNPTENTFAPAVVLITSTIIDRPAASGGALVTSTSIFFSTSLGETSAAVISSASPLPKTGAESSSDSNSKVIIGSVIGGVGGLVGILISIWLCFVWRKKRKGQRNKPVIDDDPRFQGIDANTAGDAIENYDALNNRSNKTGKIKSRKSLKGSKTGFQEDGKRKWPFPKCSSILAKSNEDLVPYLDSQPIRPALEMAGSPGDPAGLKPELSGSPPINPIAELSPHPERSFINSPNRPSASTWSSNDVHAEGNLPHSADQSLMQPNLSIIPNTLDHQNPQIGDGNRHVMSWMNYEDADGHTNMPESTTVPNDIDTR